MRPIDADALIEKCGEWYVEEGPEEGFIGTLEQLLSEQPETNCSEFPNNSDTISKQAAIDTLKKRLFETAFNNVGIKQDVDETLADVAENRFENWFNELPSIQPERKTGRWIPDGSELGIKCNKCGKSFSDYVNAGTGYMFLEETPNFCPNCGADMRYEQDQKEEKQKEKA